MKILNFFIALVLVFGSAHADEETTVGGHSDLYVGRESVYFSEKASDPSSPSANNLKLYAKDKGGTTTLYTKDAIGTVQEIRVTDHGELSGLSDNDHPQYLQDAPSDGTMYGRRDATWERITLMPPTEGEWDISEGLPTGDDLYEGVRYISYGTDEELGWYDGYIYEWDGDEWIESIPEEGWMVWLIFEMVFWAFFSGGWMEVGSGSYWALETDQLGITGNKSGSFNITTTGTVEADALVTTDGTSSDFLKGDGSLDSSTYLTAEVDGSTTNELQDLSLLVNTLSLSDSVATVDLSGYLDNTDDQTCAEVSGCVEGAITSLAGAVLTDQSTPQTIGLTGTRLAKLWATDVAVTNAIDGSVTGNAGTASALAADPSDCSVGTVATAIGANGNLTCGITPLTAEADTLDSVTGRGATTANAIGTGTHTIGGTTGGTIGAALGVFTLAGIGNTYNENLLFDFESVSNTAKVTSSTGVTTLHYATDSFVLGFGAGAGGDGRVTFDGNSLNIIANNVTATDDLILGGRIIQTNGRNRFYLADTTGANTGDGTKRAVSVSVAGGIQRISCNDADGCTCTMDESGFSSGDIAIIVCDDGSVGACEFADTDGVQSLSAAFTMDGDDTLMLMYNSNEWLEVSRSVN